MEGRIEAHYQGEWGTVCDDNFNTNSDNARVACRQLGLSGGTSITNTNYRGDPSQPITLDDVDCDGSENRLIDCDHVNNHD